MKLPLLLAVTATLLVPAAAAADPDFHWFGPGKRGPWPLQRSRARLGIEITRMTPELRRFFGAPEDRGVLVARVMTGSPAQKAGIKVGDVVVDANGRAVRRLRDLLRGKWRQGGEVRLGVVRGRQRAEIVAKIPKNRDGFHPFYGGKGPPFFGGKGRGFFGARPYRFFGGKRGDKFKWFGRDELRGEMDKLRERLRKLEKRLGEKKPRKPI